MNLSAAIEEANNEVTTVIADSLLHSSRSPCNDGYPVILIEMKSSDTAVCFKPFYHYKGFSPRNPTKRGAARAYLMSFTVYTREYNYIFKNLLNRKFSSKLKLAIHP